MEISLQLYSGKQQECTVTFTHDVFLDGLQHVFNATFWKKAVYLNCHLTRAFALLYLCAAHIEFHEQCRLLTAALRRICGEIKSCSHGTSRNSVHQLLIQMFK